MSTYIGRVDRETTVVYDGTRVVIEKKTDAYGSSQVDSVSISDIGALIQALQDIQKIKYREW